METKAEKELNQAMQRADIQMKIEEEMEGMTDEEKLNYLHNLRDITYILANKIFSLRRLHNTVPILHNSRLGLHII